MSSLKSFLITLGAPLFGIVVALGLVELGVRTLGSSAPRGPKWSDRPVFYFRAPGAPTMQNYPYNPRKPAGTYRIAVVGDSFTFAPFMQFTDTFSYKLQQMLKVNGSPRNVEVINYGVPAYSTSHEIDTTKQALEEGADLIILQITLNDPEIKAHRPSGLTEHMQDRFGPLKLKGTTKTLARYWKTLGFVLTRLHNSKTHQAYIDYFTGLFMEEKTWKPFTESMTRLVELAKGSKTPIVAVVFPLFGMPMDEKYPFYPIHTKVKDLMTSLEVPSLDVSDIYQGIPLEHLQVIPGVDRHPNEIAHRMAAEHIYLWLEGQKMIPEEFVITEKFATRLGINRQRPWVPPVPPVQQ
ncbi:MAG: hypothetical protein RL518_790 [Pseudomonadota bacterium]